LPGKDRPCISRIFILNLWLITLPPCQGRAKREPITSVVLPVYTLLTSCHYRRQHLFILQDPFFFTWAFGPHRIVASLFYFLATYSVSRGPRPPPVWFSPLRLSVRNLPGRPFNPINKRQESHSICPYAWVCLLSTWYFPVVHNCVLGIPCELERHPFGFFWPCEHMCFHCKRPPLAVLFCLSFGPLPTSDPGVHWRAAHTRPLAPFFFFFPSPSTSFLAS